MYFRFLLAEEFRPKGQGYKGDFLWRGKAPPQKIPLKKAALAAR